MTLRHNKTMGRRWATVGAALFAAVGLTAAPREANAQSVLERFVLSGEIGVGTQLMNYQVQTLQQQFHLHGGGRLRFNFIDVLGIQASFTSALFPSDRGAGQFLGVTGGLRFDPRIGSFARLWVDANAGLGQTVSKSRFTVDGGLGFEFQLHRAVGLGPYGRVTWVMASDVDYPSDALFWTAGLSLSLRVPRTEQRPATPGDQDRDGVLDPDDQCVTEPQGDHPDPERRGCPLRDTDSDGVYDNEDQCVNQPQGDHPDPARRGCPLADTDSDGVYDNEDQCVNTPAGEHPDPERRGCPDGDDDNDRVLNHSDQCPREPMGLIPDPARAGCPAPDRDHDTVPDASDACPDQPGAPSTNPRTNGCPGLVSVGDGALRITRPVFFATNRDTILPRSFPVLRAVREALAATPQIRHVSIDGHTDDVGDDARNMDLSQRRANSVMQWLTSNGIAADRLEAHGLGETRPLQPIDGLRGRALNTARGQNRRVEFRITDPAPPSR